MDVKSCVNRGVKSNVKCGIMKMASMFFIVVNRLQESFEMLTYKNSHISPVSTNEDSSSLMHWCHCLCQQLIDNKMTKCQ